MSLEPHAINRTDSLLMVRIIFTHIHLFSPIIFILEGKKNVKVEGFDPFN
jgi:hypothetical protein